MLRLRPCGYHGGLLEANRSALNSAASLMFRQTRMPNGTTYCGTESARRVGSTQVRIGQHGASRLLAEREKGSRWR